jgi:DNA-binding protein HU-beta
MNKKGLIEKVAAELQTTNAAAERYVNAFVNALSTGLKKDREVTIVGFGSWVVKKRAPRTGRNPQTGEPIKIKAGNTVRFRAGKQLKNEL